MILNTLLKKKAKHQPTNTQTNFSSWFQLRAQITLWNRIFPGQWFCLKWIPPFISPHPYWPFAEDGAGVVQHCFTRKPSHTFTPNHSHATWRPSLHQHAQPHACLLMWSVSCTRRYNGNGTPLTRDCVLQISLSHQHCPVSIPRN